MATRADSKKLTAAKLYCDRFERPSLKRDVVIAPQWSWPSHYIVFRAASACLSQFVSRQLDGQTVILFQGALREAVVPANDDGGFHIKARGEIHGSRSNPAYGIRARGTRSSSTAEHTHTSVAVITSRS